MAQSDHFLLIEGIASFILTFVFIHSCNPFALGFLVFLIATLNQCKTYANPAFSILAVFTNQISVHDLYPILLAQFIGSFFAFQLWKNINHLK